MMMMIIKWITIVDMIMKMSISTAIATMMLLYSLASSQMCLIPSIQQGTSGMPHDEFEGHIRGIS
jgi:uncharacterized membrane protein